MSQLKETLTTIFYRAAFHFGKGRPKAKDVEEVVDYLVEVMKDMHLTILPDNLLPKKRKGK